MFKWLFDWEWSRRSAERGTGDQLESVMFTVRNGVRYRATIVLSWIEQMAASNEVIAGKLSEAGFEKIVITGSGAQRAAEATWAGPDTTGPIDPHLRDVAEVTEVAASG